MEFAANLNRFIGCFGQWLSPLYQLITGGMSSETPAPTTYLKHSQFNEYVLRRCLPAIKSYRAPQWLCFNDGGHIETIVAGLLRMRPWVQLVRERVVMPNGATLGLDWESKFSKALSDDAPLIILVPGMNCCSKDSNIRFAVATASRAGYRTVVFHHKGTFGLPFTHPQMYSAGNTHDLRFAVEHVRRRHPKARLFTAAWSLGANVLLRYLAEEGDSSPFVAAVSICNPFDLEATEAWVSKGIKRFYDFIIAVSLKAFVFAHFYAFLNTPHISFWRVLSAWSVRAFDAAVTVPAFGYESVEQYRKDAGSVACVPQIRTPLLCVQAADDPMVPWHATPIDLLRDLNSCITVVTPKGGHLGFLSANGGLMGAAWYNGLMLDWLAAVQEWTNGGGKSGATHTVS